MSKNKLTLEDFLELDYQMVIDPYEDTENDEKGFILTCPDLPGIKVFGETLEEAFDELLEAKIAWFDLKEELGEEVLPPKIKTRPSGRVTLRLPVYLHEQVIEHAEENKISLNNALTGLISEGLKSVEYKSIKQDFGSLVSEMREIRAQNDKVLSHGLINFKLDSPFKTDRVTLVYQNHELGQTAGKLKEGWSAREAGRGDRLAFV